MGLHKKQRRPNNDRPVGGYHKTLRVNACDLMFLEKMVNSVQKDKGDQ